MVDQYWIHAGAQLPLLSCAASDLFLQLFALAVAARGLLFRKKQCASCSFLELCFPTTSRSHSGTVMSPFFHFQHVTLPQLLA